MTYLALNVNTPSLTNSTFSPDLPRLGASHSKDNGPAGPNQGLVDRPSVGSQSERISWRLLQRM